MKVHEFLGEKFGFLRLLTEHDFCELHFLNKLTLQEKIEIF
jgi:hypothetical protein